MRISNQRKMIRISNEYSLGCVGVAVYGQRYGGTIKLTSPEAFGMPYLESRSIRSLFHSACFVDECRVSLVKYQCIDCIFCIG